MKKESKKNRKDSEEDNKIADTPMAVDRISQLPDHLLHHFLSFLELTDFARVFVLSKSLNQIWLEAPIFDSNLHFYFDYNEKKPSLMLQDDEIDREAQEEFLSSIDESLRRHLPQSFSGSVFSMWITIPTLELELLVPYMDQWMGTVIQNNLQKLELVISTDDNDNSSNSYRLPQTLFSAKWLTILELCGCTLDSNCDIKLSHLRRLVLRQVCLLDENMLSNLAFNSPLIEILKVKQCKGFKSLRLVPTLQQLKHVEVELYLNPRQFHFIEIAVPHLRTFSFEGRRPWDRVIFVSVRDLKELKVSQAQITDEEFQNLMSNLPKLEVLEWRFCNWNNTIRISSQKLKKLKLVPRFNLSFAEIDTPNLFSLSLDYDHRSHFSFTSSFHLLKVNLLIRGVRSHDFQWLAKLKSLVMKWCQSNDIKISVVHHVETMILIHEKFSEFQPSTLRCLGNEFSTVNIHISSKSLEEVVWETFANDTKNLSIAWSISNPKQVLYDIVQQAIEEAFGCGECELEDSQEAEDEMNPTWKLFVKSHLTVLYGVTTFRIKWKTLER